MTNKLDLSNLSQQLYECFRHSDQEKQKQAMAKLENEILDYSKCNVFNCNQGENHD